jgi:hypothetical protein
MLIDTTASTGIPSDSRSLPFARMRQFGTFATSVFPSYRLTCIVGFVSLNWCYFTSSEMSSPLRLLILHLATDVLNRLSKSPSTLYPEGSLTPEGSTR